MKVYLDMDGVLVDFLDGIHRAFSVPYSTDKHPYEKGKWNMLEDIGKPFCDDKFSFEAVNNACTAEFWSNLKFMHDGLDIFDAVSDKFPDEDIYFLTTPMPNDGSWLGKVEWIRRYFSTFKKRLIITQAPKSLLAGPDTLLIDDRDENIEEFVAAGGRGLLVPRSWNKAHFCADRTLDVVKKFLEDL